MRVRLMCCVAVALTITSQLRRAHADAVAPARPVGFVFFAADAHGSAHEPAARRIAELAAERMGGRLMLPTRTAKGTQLDSALALGEAGNLDEAAATADALIDAGTRDPRGFADPSALVRALVLRAWIALARGETERAERLLEHVVRYQPEFRPELATSGQRLSVALERVRARVGASAQLDGAQLGSACQDPVLFVGRALTGGFDMQRFDRCRPIVTVRVAASDDPALPAALLTSDVAASVGRGELRSKPRRWLWGVVAGVVVASVAVTVGMYVAATDGIDVHPRL